MAPFPDRLPSDPREMPREVMAMLAAKLWDQQVRLRGSMHRLIEAMYRGEHRKDAAGERTVSYATRAHECWPLIIEDTNTFLVKREAAREARRQQELPFAAPAGETPTA